MSRLRGHTDGCSSQRVATTSESVNQLDLTIRYIVQNGNKVRRDVLHIPLLDCRQLTQFDPWIFVCPVPANSVLEVSEAI